MQQAGAVSSSSAAPSCWAVDTTQSSRHAVRKLGGQKKRTQTDTASLLTTGCSPLPTTAAQPRPSARPQKRVRWAPEVATEVFFDKAEVQFVLNPEDLGSAEGWGEKHAHTRWGRGRSRNSPMPSVSYYKSIPALPAFQSKSVEELRWEAQQGEAISSGSHAAVYRPRMLETPQHAVGNTPPGKEENDMHMMSISCMRVYASKSVEELRWEDHQAAALSRSKLTPSIHLKEKESIDMEAAGEAMYVMSISGMPNYSSKSVEELHWEDCQRTTLASGTHHVSYHKQPEHSKVVKPPHGSQEQKEEQESYLTSITAMPAYGGKSIEELRWEDCQAGGARVQAPAQQQYEKTIHDGETQDGEIIESAVTCPAGT